MTSVIDIRALSTEFGVSEPVMAAFVERFCPAVVEANTFAETSDVVLFVHIPKTAGVSVGRALRDAFDTFYGVKWDDVSNSFRRVTRRACYDQTAGTSRQVIMGHYGWTQLKTWIADELPLKCATIFRDPVARVVSNYNYNLSEAHPANAEFAAKFESCEQYAASVARDFQLTKAVGPVASFEHALQKLTAHYSFLGITEQLGKSLAHFSSSHGLPPMEEHRKNVGAPADVAQPDEVVSLVSDRSRNDVLLHRLLTELYA